MAAAEIHLAFGVEPERAEGVATDRLRQLLVGSAPGARHLGLVLAERRERALRVVARERQAGAREGEARIARAPLACQRARRLEIALLERDERPRRPRRHVSRRDALERVRVNRQQVRPVRRGGTQRAAQESR